MIKAIRSFDPEKKKIVKAFKDKFSALQSLDLL